MPTTKQDADFAEAVCNPRTLLDYSIEWIASNLSPDDVFNETQLERWAEANGYVKGE